MSAEKIAAKLRRKALGYTRERNAAGVGGEDGVGAPMDVDVLPQRALDIKVLGDSLDYPIAFRNSRQVIVEVARGYQACSSFREESRRLLFTRGVDATLRGQAAVRLIGDDDIEQENGYTCI